MGLIMRRGHSITKNDDSVKQKLLDSLAEEPPMVLSTAYAYAKNYVQYGEDITKAWTTAVQQASVIQEVREKAWVEAYDSFKKEYENRLKADMVAMLEEVYATINRLYTVCHASNNHDELIRRNHALDIIQEKINTLGGNENA